jgi:uncharacterized metal-binding protein YceD (DUF177 family)
MTANDASKKISWSVRVRRDDVPESGRHLEFAADEAVRAAIAAVAGLRALPRLEARFDVARQGDGLKVAGEVTATIEQTCVVTLEPLTSELREPIDLVFLPADATPRDADDNADDPDADAINPDADDEPEHLVDGAADLGAVATEFLLLAIDPYPRKPGAEFEAPKADDSGAHPFAALAALKKTPPPE